MPKTARPRKLATRPRARPGVKLLSVELDEPLRAILEELAAIEAARTGRNPRRAKSDVVRGLILAAHRATTR